MELPFSKNKYLKNSLFVCLFVFITTSLKAQDQDKLEEGSVSFLTSRNVYVKFNSTHNIEPGDTLFIRKNGQLRPALLVENKSSSSTVCKSINNIEIKLGDLIIARPRLPEPREVTKEEKPKPTTPVLELPTAATDPVVKPDVDEDLEIRFKEKIKGRLSAASYSNFSDYRNSTRMRYAFSYRGYNLNDSPISVESYVTFRHQLSDTINFAEAFKVYSLSAKYEFDQNTSLTLGRKINPKFSSMGAIDGLQFEKGFGNFSMGLIAGSRPDFENYGFNFNLMQFGAYASMTSNAANGYTQTTLGFINQTNRGNTDRRFVYFQHSSSLAKNLSLFSSFEVDLFQNINEQIQNTAQLTNIYAALRYRMKRNLRFSFAYDNRRNIIYYETYKNFIDQLIADETRQGFRFSVNHRPFKTVSWGFNTGLRFQKSGQNPSRNYSGHITVSKLPFIDARASFRANFLQTDIIDSQIFGTRLSKSFAKNKFRGELYYRWVDYKYKIGDRVLHQDIVGASMAYNIRKDMSLHIFYEGVFDNNKQLYHRFNTRIIKRF